MCPPPQITSTVANSAAKTSVISLGGVILTSPPPL